jgi:hypothetical protein
MNIKNYIESEISRNKLSADLYERMLRKAFGNVEVLVGHHFVFEDPVAGLPSENEIPSADTVLFDHDIMTACFGEDAVRIMQTLAATPVESRDTVLREYIDLRAL